MAGGNGSILPFYARAGRFWLDAARAVELTSSVCRVMEQIRREAEFLLESYHYELKSDKRDYFLSDFSFILHN